MRFFIQKQNDLRKWEDIQTPASRKNV